MSVVPGRMRWMWSKKSLGERERAIHFLDSLLELHNQNMWALSYLLKLWADEIDRGDKAVATRAMRDMAAQIEERIPE